MPDLPATRPAQLGSAVTTTAKPDSPSPTLMVLEGSKGSLRMCVLSLGGELFAIDLRNIREVFEVESVTAVPGMPSMLTGVTNLRGTVIPLLDLRASLGLEVTTRPCPFAVVIRQGARQVGIFVDHVPEIRYGPT